MKKLVRVFLVAIIAVLSLSACGLEGPATITPDATTETLTEIEKQVVLNYERIVSVAIEKLEAVRCDDLSKDIQAYESESVELPGDLTEDELEYYDAAISYIVDSMPEDLSAYDQYRYFAFVLSLRTEYDYSLDEDGRSMTAYGPISEGLGVCMGYTKAFQALCERADLWCETITGFARWNSDDHGWNLVKLDDGTYYIDVTWCDQYGDPGTAQWQRCFMLTETVLQEDHGVWEGGPATGTRIFEG